MMPRGDDIWPVIDPSRFIHQITFLDQTVVADASGNRVDYAAGSPPETAWCEIAPVRGTDLIKAGQDVSQTFITVKMNYRSTVTAQRRIQSPNGSVYIIRAVENVREMNMLLVLTCLAIGSAT